MTGSTFQIKNIFTYLILCWVLVISSTLNAQNSDEKPIEGAISLFSIGYGGDIPFGDIKSRFGNTLKFTLSGEHITSSGWIYNTDFFFMFGDKVKEDPISSFRTTEGFILGDDGLYADLFLRMRGVYLGVGFGKLFQLRENSRSGIKAILNAGVLQHNIRFVDERNSVPQLRADGQKGYDRLTRGFALKETIAYKHLSRNRLLNYEIALDFIQGFTSEVRAINFDTGAGTIQSRMDLMLGVRICWQLPFYHTAVQTIYY
ncbi:MAG: hypothetical protein IPM42_13530 [Saprospiraceae bacterium]|nr:hypothetical protein [Saprospiraceae bacterium]